MILEYAMQLLRNIRCHCLQLCFLVRDRIQKLRFPEYLQDLYRCLPFQGFYNRKMHLKTKALRNRELQHF